MFDEYSLGSLTIVTPNEVKHNTSITIVDGRIDGFSKSKKKNYDIEGAYILFPALINAHDHLFGSYHPKIGTSPYICWLPWDYDLKNSPVYEERNKNNPFDIYLAGAYKNLISGVTTVHDHIPHHINDPFIDKLPIRVLKDYSLSHEASMYDLKWGDGIGIEHKRAVKNNIPYVTHIEEGFDVESLRGIENLEEQDALSEHTVLVHGIGFSKGDINKVANRNAHFVWCPGSNYFMFKRTAKVKEIHKAGINMSIGTDSPASGELNLIDEIKFAKKIYKEMYNEELDDKLIVDMITVNPAEAFRIQDKLGSLEKGKLGDLLLISGDANDPYSSLVNAGLKDIALVIMEGFPLYGDNNFSDIFKDSGKNYSIIHIDGKEKLIIGDPKGLMKRVSEVVGFEKKLPFLPI
ncbi:MAG TPA: hydrolase [Spirochaetes bacterium]|nr:hydrolase [Spirochaetota bacterium]